MKARQLDLFGGALMLPHKKRLKPSSVSTNSMDEIDLRLAEIDATFFAWLAGFIDGEGCFHIQQSKQHNRINFYLQLIITNTNREVLESIQETLDIGTIIATSRKKPHNSRSSFQYKIYGNKVKTVAQLLYPYLKVKQTQCKAFIDFPESGRGAKVPADIQFLRRRLYHIVRGANSTGHYL